MARPYDQAIVDVAHYVYHYTLDESDATIWERARIALLDALGCAIETAATSIECQRLIQPLVEGTIVPGGFKVPGTSLKVDLLEGIFDLGVLIRYLDHNDALGGAEWGHPSGKSHTLLDATVDLCKYGTW